MGHLYPVDTTDDIECNKRYDILSIGEGAVWVINKGTNPVNGDLIIASDVSGYGEIANDDIIRSNIVGKLTCSWDLSNLQTRTVGSYQAKLMGIVVYCG